MNLIGLRSDSPLVQYMDWDGELHYPSTDGQPLGNDTEHIDWIIFIFEAIREAFANRDDVFVACDLLWYPVEGRPDITRAADVMVVVGRPKGRRPSYKQWEEGGIGPQFVVEVASRSNTAAEFREKLAFYERYGVQEYLVYDFTRAKLTVWTRSSPQEGLNVVSHDVAWTSSLLGLGFSLIGDGELELVLPEGVRARSREEILRDWVAAQTRSEEARQEAEAARQETEAARQETEAARQETEAARQRAERLAAKLRELGIDPEA